MKFEGTYTALVTPLRHQEIDEETFGRLVQRQIAGGVDGVVPLGTTGETPTITVEEQRRIVEIAVQEAGGRPVIVGTGTNATATTIERSLQAQELGASGLLVVTPFYSKPGRKGIIAHFQAVAEAVDLPIIVYNIAGRTGRNIDTPTMGELAQIPNIVAVKEASQNVDQVNDVAQQIPDLTILSGDDSYTLPILAVGGRGVIAVTSNLLPATMSRMVNAVIKENDYDEARRLHLGLLPLFRALFFETNPLPIKTAMAHWGLLAEEFRLPMCPIEGPTKERLLQVVAGYADWE